MPESSDSHALHRSSGPHVLVPDLESCVLAADDRHHLAKSLRLRDGDQFTVTDGRGGWRAAIFGPTVEPCTEIAAVPEPNPRLAVGFALVKSAKPELIVQKLTELGINHIQPVRCDRSVVQWDDAKATKAQERLSRVAREALMQSKGAWMPEVHEAVDFRSLLKSAAAGVGPITSVVRADFDGPSFLDAGKEIIRAGSMIIVGPEGGWSDDERAIAPLTVSLGDRVLRAETACIAVGVLAKTVQSL